MQFPICAVHFIHFFISDTMPVRLILGHQNLDDVTRFQKPLKRIGKGLVLADQVIKSGSNPL